MYIHPETGAWTTARGAAFPWPGVPAFPGVPSTWLQYSAYQAGYWLARNHEADARAIAAQPWQSSWIDGTSPIPTLQVYYWHRAGLADGVWTLTATPNPGPRQVREGLTDPGDKQVLLLAYDAGWNDAKGDPTAAGNILRQVDIADLGGDLVAYWHSKGIADALGGKPKRYSVSTDSPPTGARPGTRAAPAYVPKGDGKGSVWVPPPPGPVAPVPAGAMYLEVVAELPIIGKVPFDQVVAVRNTAQGQVAAILRALATFHLLGTHRNDERRGFGLSGAGGAVERYVKELIFRGRLRPVPETYGLRAWVGARVSSGSGITLLSLQTLRSLGITRGY